MCDRDRGRSRSGVIGGGVFGRLGRVGLHLVRVVAWSLSVVVAALAMVFGRMWALVM